MKKIINPWRNHPEYNCLNQEKAKEMGFIVKLKMNKKQIL